MTNHTEIATAHALARIAELGEEIARWANEKAGLNEDTEIEAKRIGLRMSFDLAEKIEKIAMGVLAL
jgi:hypothetical protein